MSPPPAISVLLPARNAAATLAPCLVSVLRSRERDLECVMVDDASTDATRSIAERFARRDARVRVIPGPGRGLVAALEAGLAACRAPLVARMDADDLAHRDRLGLERRTLESDPRLAAVGCHVRIFPRRGLRPGLREYERWLRGITSAAQVRREAWVECPLPHPTWMWRRSVLAGLGYRACGWPEDYDLLLRALAAGHEIGVVPRRLLAWRDGDARLWRTHPDYAPERFLACKAAHLAQTFLRAHEHYILWGHGETGRALRRALAEHGRRPAYVLELHPRRVGETIRGAPVVRPEALPRLPPLPVVTAVSGAFARSEIRALLARLGRREGIDFVCAA